MKRSLSVLTFICVFVGMQFGWAQASKTATVKHPASFTITKISLDHLFACKENSVAKDKTNKYINGSTVLLNSVYKENKQLKLKLDHFKNAELIVQINGKDSKILYITSTDNSVFYNSKETEKG